MTDYERKFEIYGSTPASSNLELVMRDTIAELTQALGTEELTHAHRVTLHIADIFAATQAVVLELESRINRLEDQLKK